MQHEVGSIVEGKVTGITKFGAFVELEGGSVGMVHISEISQSFVNDIAEFLKEGDMVKVKVLSIGNDGKISLSIKRALPPDSNQPQFQKRETGFRSGGAPRPNPGGFNGGSRPPSRASAGVGRASPPGKDDAFENMLSKFMKSSDDKMADLKQPERRHGYKKDSRDYD